MAASVRAAAKGRTGNVTSLFRLTFVLQSKHQLEIDQADLKSQNTELIANNAALSAMKRKVENEVQIARNELDECLNELKASEERSRKAAADADRLAEEVRQEQEHAAHVDRQRKGLELTAKELQAKIEDAERAMLQFGQKALSKVEEKVRQVTAQYHAETRRHQDAIKGLAKQERRSRELQFQVNSMLPSILHAILPYNITTNCEIVHKKSF
ncbi:unnamed protein product [Haemonchus placei]|uniref:Myosin_tail_1 domain-containing protein n=1 Tax=Haemonchus placei TaxID=6290 RepID=A0A0N4VXS8_HAEPC|nr:unnamed protein product [Haemonchus placei]